MKKSNLGIIIIFILMAAMMNGIVTAQLKIQKPVSSIKSGSYIADQKVKLSSKNKNAKIYYTIDGREPGEKSLLYTSQFTLNQTTTIKAIAVDKGMKSEVMILNFVKIENIESLVFKNQPSRKFRVNNIYSLLSTEKASENPKDGTWLAFEKEDFEAVITFKNAVSISSVNITCMQKTDLNIYFPSDLELFISPDGKSFFKSGMINADQLNSDDKFKVKSFEVQSRPAAIKAIKIFAKNKGVIQPAAVKPVGKAWLFINKISYK